jgi:dienelactone hydrolase
MAPCEELAREYANAGGRIEVKVYPGASHGFDGDPANTRLFRLSASRKRKQQLEMFLSSWMCS